MGAAKVLVPLGLLTGLGATVGFIALRARKAKASPLEEKPLTPRQISQQGRAGDEVTDTYNRAMAAETRDLDYLRDAADFLERSGKPRWAREVRQKRDSIMAATGAAESQARAEVARQAATPAAELEAGKQEWEKAAGGAPTQANVDTFYEWAIRPDSTDTAMVQNAYQMVIAYDSTPNKAQKIAVLADKLAKLKAGTYGVAPSSREAAAMAETPAVEVTPAPAMTEPPGDILPEVTVKAGGSEVKVPEPDEEGEEPERGVPLPPLPPAPSPSPPAAQGPSTSTTPELAKEETSAPADPNGTIALARVLIETESQPGWKGKHKAMVKSWQKAVGYSGAAADGKFGPGSALKMAREVGVLPLIRYYPKGSPTKAAAVEKYREQLYDYARVLDGEGKKEHAKAIRESAVHEKGQGWPTTPTAVPTEQRLAMYDSLLSTLAGG